MLLSLFLTWKYPTSQVDAGIMYKIHHNARCACLMAKSYTFCKEPLKCEEFICLNQTLSSMPRYHDTSSVRTLRAYTYDIQVRIQFFILDTTIAEDNPDVIEVSHCSYSANNFWSVTIDVIYGVMFFALLDVSLYATLLSSTGEELGNLPKL